MKNIYYTPIKMTEEGDIIFWAQYKNYLLGKDTTFVLKEFGIPNLKDKNKKSCKYFLNSDCDYNFNINKQKQPQVYSCIFINFEFDENYDENCRNLFNGEFKFQV